MRRAAFAVVWIALLGMAAVGCGGDDDEGAATTAPTITERLPTETETIATDTTATEPSGQGDAVAGKAVFASVGCGGCHTLSEAGSSGTVGPRLDDANVSFDRVVEQVTNGGGAMPPFGESLSQQQISDVAAFVSQASAS